MPKGVDETQPVPIRTRNIDGMIHRTAGKRCEWEECDALRGRRCLRCRKGRLHTQPVYGGIADACEECDGGWSDGDAPDVGGLLPEDE